MKRIRDDVFSSMRVELNKLELELKDKME